MEIKEASYEARKRLLESDLPERIDVRVRRERRRSWEPAEKLRIVQEAFAAGAVAKRVAEQYEISTGLLFTWRRQLRKSTAVKFLPVQVTDESGTTIAASPAREPNEAAIEIEMPNGARVRIGTGADLNVVRGVLAALVGR